jgi:multiple sugar transport system permease protein
MARFKKLFSGIQETKGRTLISEADFKKPAVKFGYWLVFALLLGATVTTLFPLLWTGLSALKNAGEIGRIPPTLFPQDSWNWANYKTTWQKVNFPLYYFNTILLCFYVWIVQIIVNSMAAFSLAKIRPFGNKFFLFIFLSTLMVPFQAIMIPLYITLRNLPIVGVSLINSYWAIVLPAAANAFFIYLLMGFFETIPDDLIEAGHIDGASELRIFFQLIIPLSKPVLAVVTIFSVMGTWNDFFWPYIVISSENIFPIMVKLYTISTASTLKRPELLSALMIASIPPIVLFLFFQKQIMRGITLTGLKG